MEHLWTIPCQLISVDQETRALSLIHLLENIQFDVSDLHREGKELLQLALPMQVVTLWQRSDLEVEETGQARLTFVSPQGRVFVDESFDVPLITSTRYRYTLQFPTIPYDVPGTYTFNSYRKTARGAMRRVNQVLLPMKVITKTTDDLAAESQ